MGRAQDICERQIGGGTAQALARRANSGEASLHPFCDSRPFKFGQGGQNVQLKSARSRRAVDPLAQRHERDAHGLHVFRALLERHGKGPTAIWTLRDQASLSEQERMCLESYDIVKGNVDQSDDALETVIKPRWYAKDRALELCARSLGMLKDTATVTISEELIARLNRAKVRAREARLALPGADPPTPGRPH